MKNSLAPLQLELLPKRLAKGDWNARREPGKHDRRRAAVLADPAPVERLAGRVTEPAPSTPAHLAARLRDDLKRWRGIVEASGASIG